MSRILDRIGLISLVLFVLFPWVDVPTAAFELSTVEAGTAPNVLIVLSDDQGWGDLSVNGNANLDTPHIDSLARDGASFERFYVCPVCSPTRAEFLTGRYHARSGVYSTSAGGERLNLDEMTIADTFHAAGYTTGAFGKWHNGMQYPYHPLGRGFEEFYGFCSGHWGDYFSPLLERNGRLVQGHGFCIDDFTNQAMHFMEATVADGRPFFAYLPYNTPHSPMQVPDEYWSKFSGAELSMHNRDPDRENLQHVRCALAMCENIDWNVGRLLRKLDELQVSENTIVIYFCDNGPNGYRWNGDMKGRKGSTDEGGVRSPMLIRWPSHIAGGKVVPHIGAAIDLLPTLAELTGVPLISEHPLDGRSLAPLLTEEAAEWPDRAIVSHWRDRISVRNQRFRLDHQGALFDIAADPGQRHDVASQFPKETANLKTVTERFRQSMSGYDDDQRPFVIGDANFLYTQLPARDAQTTGAIKRSNKFPNCSYFTNWTSLKESIHWDVEVRHPGRYQVNLYYACAAADAGSRLRLSLGEARLDSQIELPHDPPLRGQEHDRVERIESYIKDFRPMDMGTIKLSAGKGKLQLAATEIPGNQVMDFRLLMLTRIED